MADNALTKKLGPLPRWGWGAVGGGVFLAYFLYKRYESGTTTGTTTTSTSGGTSVPIVDVVDSTPNATTGTTTTTTPTATSFTNFTEWEQAVIKHLNTLGLSPATSVNAVQSWIRGGCVTQQGYNGLSSAVGAVGLPPGFGTSLPTLSVCASAPTTPTTTTTVSKLEQELSGSGYQPTATHRLTTLTGGTGGKFVLITSPTQLTSLAKQGFHAYYQPTPGTFEVAPAPGVLAVGTPLFFKTTATAPTAPRTNPH
jgi:hypothetical protein